jgi:hypothetical protein
MLAEREAQLLFTVRDPFCGDVMRVSRFDNAFEAVIGYILCVKHQFRLTLIDRLGDGLSAGEQHPRPLAYAEKIQ